MLETHNKLYLIHIEPTYIKEQCGTTTHNIYTKMFKLIYECNYTEKLRVVCVYQLPEI